MKLFSICICTMILILSLTGCKKAELFSGTDETIPASETASLSTEPAICQEDELNTKETENETEAESEPETGSETENQTETESETESQTEIVPENPYDAFSEAKDLAVEALSSRLWEAYDSGYSDAPAPLMASYDTENIYIEKAAFVYDNAVAALAFISEDMETEAAMILDAFVYAAAHDRYENGYLRNAYLAGDIVSGDEAAMPGWWDAEAGAWYEDRYQVGSNPGNTSYVVLAMLEYDTVYETDRYLETAKTLMDRVLSDCTDGRDGFTGGFEGWPETGTVFPLTYRSTEHNIDAYAAFKALYDVTKEEKYRQASESAYRFILAMYDPDSGAFMVGTETDGATPNRSGTMLDTQSWTALAFGEDFEPYMKAFEAVERMKTEAGGYAFSDAQTEVSWSEGTAFTALSYRSVGEDMKAVGALNSLLPYQTESGLLKAADETMDTGLELFDGSAWCYGPDPHVASTAWFILAVNGLNPYHPGGL